jgi:hypothetical protein
MKLHPPHQHPQRILGTLGLLYLLSHRSVTHAKAQSRKEKRI